MTSPPPLVQGFGIVRRAQVLADGAMYLEAMLRVRPGFRYPDASDDGVDAHISMLVTAPTSAEQDPASLVDGGTRGDGRSWRLQT